MTKAIKPTAAYVHIPFCSHICYYCDFAKVLLEGQPVDAYLDALLTEFESYQIEKLHTLYIGGGTPTVLTLKQMDRLLTGLTKNLDLSVLEELTIEANPSDLSADMIALLADSPVNRLSLGVQSFDDRLLRRIGRQHTRADALKAIEQLKEAGFDNITLDLIYGLPGQTISGVKADLAQFLELDLPHIALYSLILEDHTRFMALERLGKLNLPDTDKNADMYEYIVETLKESGYQHYEISNFAKTGYESKHNLTYWDNNEYYGIGAGASGYISGCRYKNHGPVHHYLEAANKRVTEEVLTKKQKMEEEMFLGLRKASGVDLGRFAEKFQTSFDSIYGSVTEKMLQTALITRENNCLRLTEKGFELGNEVFQEFLLDE